MATQVERVPHDGTSVQELARNGRRRYEWRLVDGARTLVVVGLRFTVPAHDGETDEQFEARMLALCATLAALGFPVVVLDVEGREHAHKRPWALFECRTPADRFERVTD